MANNGTITEWEFTAEAASWINRIIDLDSSLPFSAAKCEQRGRDSQKRRDLTLLDKNKRIVLTGEVKLPYRKDGGTPFNAEVVSDARSKAARAGADFFFTWNVNEFVLWETVPAKTAWKEQNYKTWKVTSVHKEAHMDQPMTATAIQDWLTVFLNEFSKILRGVSPIGHRSPDEMFIEILESALRMPINLTLEELDNRYKLPRQKAEIDGWMRDEQGWTIYDDPEGIRDNLERASKFACYALVNKLVFYEALLKRFGTKLERVNILEHIDTGEALRHHLEKYFADAKEVTGDYETVFGEDHKSLGNRIPFYADSAVTHWRGLINQIHKFDFSKLDYEIIGSIFERLISPEERHKFGQFYTRVEVVDLINSFCIRTGKETVMDPACGGGTFLVRAYARKRELSPSQKHGDLLSHLFGVDISHFATHLTTINLATRDLIDAENYPHISRSNFFDVRTHKTFISLPTHIKIKGLGTMQHRNVEIPPLDAVIGNPPYVRQEEIPKAKKKGKEGPESGTKDFYRQLVKAEGNIELSGRSDLHSYFWPHASTFLRKDGYLCFLTSSQWLDVEYGFRLQEWILSNFQIVAVFESIDEPWFVGARVATTVTILQKQDDEESRINNLVRFVQIRRPIREILEHDGTTRGAVLAADAFRDEILKLEKDISNERYRARLIKQGDLLKDGIALGQIMVGRHEEDEEDGDDLPTPSGRYYGGKWGVHLRAPDLWFTMLDRYRDQLAPLGKIAAIRRGITSGKDSFFFPKDYSEESLTKYPDSSQFEAAYRVPRKDVESGKVKLVLCGDDRGEIRPIETKYLEPEVHSLMEIDGFTVSPDDCARLILLVGKKKKDLKGTHVLDYIEWGERKNYHTGATCASRVTDERGWYDLTGHSRGTLFWPKSQQYKHAIPLNENRLQCNCNLYDIHLPDKIESTIMAGILNSTIVILAKFQYGRPVGVEGNLKTEVVDVNMMMVPDPTISTDKAKKRIAAAFNRMKERKALFLISERRLREMAYKKAGKEEELLKLSDTSELDMEDRRELDDAVLEMIGVSSKKERKELIDQLYSYLKEYFEWTRQKEEKAILNKNKAKRRSIVSPEDIASQIHNEITETDVRLLRRYDPDFLDKSKPFDTYDLPLDGTPSVLADMLIVNGSVKFMKGAKKPIALIQTKNVAQAELIELLANNGIRGLVRVPHTKEESLSVLQRYQSFLRSRTARFREMIENRTADPDMQGKIYDALLAIAKKSV